MRKKFYLILSISTLILLPSCPGENIKVYNTNLCSVSGSLSKGMICAETLTRKTSEINLEQTIKFLEADPNTGKGAALCQSSDDWRKNLTTLEQACAALKNRCKPELRSLIAVIKNKAK